MSLYPDLREPRFNLRQVTKELLLLEDHLADRRKLCAECIAKHALKAEAFVDEAKALDTSGEWADELATASEAIDQIQNALKAGHAPPHVAAIVRALRKRIQPQVW
jgi:hypothetical protein